VLRAAGAPTGLRALGLPEAALPQVAALATARPYPNPRPVAAGPLEALLRRAWAGAMPADG
jgi:alcohol dehydrogenase class IV